MDNLFFYASKLFWAFASPDHLLLLLLTLAVLVSRSGRGPEPMAKPRRGLLWTTLLLTWLVALYPFGNQLLYPLETRFSRSPLPPQSQLAGVIVLGGAERINASHHWQSLEVNAMGDRLLVMLKLLKQYPELPFIYTGGSGSALNQDLRGADLVESFLHDMALDERVMFERDSRNTHENALYSRPLLDPARSAPWLLVTSAFHMPRSVGVFRQQGVEVLPYPVDYWSLTPAEQGLHFNLAGNLSQLKIGVREWLGLLAYWLTGKTASLLPTGLPEVRHTQPDAKNHTP